MTPWIAGEGEREREGEAERPSYSITERISHVSPVPKAFSKIMSITLVLGYECNDDVITPCRINMTNSV